MIVEDLIELRKSRVLGVFYTGGDFALNSTGELLFTTCTSLIKVINVNDGLERFLIGEEIDELRVSSFVVNDSGTEIVIAYSNDLVKRYEIAEDKVVLLHQFRATHTAPIQLLKLHVNDVGQLMLATGGSDFAVKVWNLDLRYCTHNFRGKSPVTSMCFVNNGTRLAVGHIEGEIISYNLSSATAKGDRKNLKLNKHSNRISAIILASNKHNIIAFCSDQTASVLNSSTLEVIKTFRTPEAIEDAYPLDNEEVLTVSETGVLSVWSLAACKVERQLQVARCQLDSVIYCKNTQTIVCSSAECDLYFVDFKYLRITKQFAGFNDEIYDSCLVSEDLNCLAVVSNSPALRIYNLTSYSCNFVTGHTDNILAVDSPEWDDALVATGSKDNSLIVWRLDGIIDPENMKNKFGRRLAIATGHTNSVTSVKFSHSKTHNAFIVTVSADSTLKIWSLNETLKCAAKDDDDSEEECIKLEAVHTMVAHSKDINSVDVSLNDRLCVTASMDKTVKLWHIDEKQLQFGIAGTLSGHKRGVWAARFSRNNQTVATCSGDCTIKIFSLLDKSCIQTLNGHSFAVLSVLFTRNSTRLLSVDGGGLMKIWDLESGVCEKTIEAHEDKIWSIRPMECHAVVNGKRERRERYVTVGGDSRVVVWDDVSDEVKTERIKTEAKRLADVQCLQNYLQQERFVDALLLTIDLAQPYQCLTVVQKLLERENEEQIAQELQDVFAQMTPSQISILLDYASQWNTNTRHSSVSQALLNFTLRTITPQAFLKLPDVESLIQAFLPYSDRHYARLSKMMTDTSHADYVFSQMRIDDTRPQEL